MRTLFVAAGGGGDTVGVLLARRLLAPGEEGDVFIATCAWERLIVDPVPGPRSPTGFTGLFEEGGAYEVVATSETTPPGRSMLPRLAAETQARIFLLDLAGGVVSLTGQLKAIVAHIRADRLVLVDTGGDAIASGDEDSLLSPLCDAMSVAAAVRAGLPCRLAVVGPGADGELSEGEVLRRLNALGAARVGTISVQDVEPVRRLLEWHPTEASALVAASALGERELVAMRRGGAPRKVTAETAEVWDLIPSVTGLPVAGLVMNSASLEAAAASAAARSVNELEYEFAKSREMQRLDGVRREGELKEDLDRGATRVTLRRARELTGQLDPTGTFAGISLARTSAGLFRLWAENSG